MSETKGIEFVSNHRPATRETIFTMFVDDRTMANYRDAIVDAAAKAAREALAAEFTAAIRPMLDELLKPEALAGMLAKALDERMKEVLQAAIAARAAAIPESGDSVKRS